MILPVPSSVTATLRDPFVLTTKKKIPRFTVSFSHKRGHLIKKINIHGRSIACLFLVGYVKRVGSQEPSHYILFEERHTPSLPISNCPRTKLSDHPTTILQTQVQMSCDAVANFNTTS
ncbi:hypothetical protein FPOAC2_03457 [Fusarium poae]